MEEKESWRDSLDDIEPVASKQKAEVKRSQHDLNRNMVWTATIIDGIIRRDNRGRSGDVWRRSDRGESSRRRATGASKPRLMGRAINTCRCRALENGTRTRRDPNS